MKIQLKFAKSIMKNTKNKSFSRQAITNVARLVAIATVCVTMSAETFAKPPIATPIAAPATQSNAVVAPIVATQLPPSFEPVLEINLNPELAPVLAPELATVLAPQLASEQKEQPAQSNQSSLVSASCVGDLSRNGSIDSEDLGLLLSTFGCSIGCESDLNADGIVNSADLGVLLIQFGVCPAPTVTAISPAYGLASGGTTITLNGTNFFGASSVTVGGALATSVNVVSATVLTAVTPAGSIGSAVSVSVTTPGGIGTLASAFSYYEDGPLSWAGVLESLPNPDVVPDATVRAKIVASGFPWRVCDKSSGIEMLLIPGGTFTMGEEGYATPVHTVTLTKAFYMGKTEVTQAQWQATMGSNPSNFQPPNYTLDTSRPVEQVSWNDIAGFNSATGLRFPTEAEWEYACRGGTTSAFHSMPDYPNGTNDGTLLGNIAWYSGNSGPFSSSKYGTKPVAGKAANAFGMYDMSGDVWEWCNDWYGEYAADNATDPAGSSSGSYRTVRGGYWGGSSNTCRSSARSSTDPVNSYRGVGFRVAKTP